MGPSLEKSRFLVTAVMVLMATLLSTSSLVAAQDATQEVVTSEPITLVLMISDARHEVGVNAGTETSAIENGNTDVMVVIHLDPNQQACRALNLLPTTRVTIEGVGDTRLNQAMAQGGVDMSVDVIENYLGVEIDHYGVIDLDGVILAIDAIGGITVNNPQAFTVGTNEFPAGEITLSGEQAVLYARQGGEANAEGRLVQQKALVEGLMASVGGMNTLDALPVSVQGSVAQFEDHILTDITLDGALAIANAYSNCVPTEQTVETIMFSEEGPMLDEVTQQEEVSGETDPATVQAHVDWLMNGGPLPQQ